MNSTPLHIASRYLFSKKTRNVINLISGISLVVVACVTAAMIILLSAFNGIEDLVDGLYNKFDPDITIVPAKGKVLTNDSIDFTAIQQIDGVTYVSSALEETAILAKGDERKTLCKLIGVDTAFVALSGLKDDVRYGSYNLHKAGENFVIPGIGVASDLGLLIRNNEPENIRIYAPTRGRKLSLAREKAFKEELAVSTGAFTINAELDVKYVISSLEFARRIFNYEGQSSFLGIEVSDEEQSVAIKNQISEVVGDNYLVKTRKEKKPLVYETNASEKRATFLILLFVLIIAVFNGMASLTMLVLEKQRDISVLKAMGATWSFVKQVFMLEGILINVIGVAIGTAIGLTVCWLQQTFGLLRIHGTVVDFYPIKIEWADVSFIVVTVIVIGAVASVLMVNYLISRFTRA
ncbi:MAG: FtsX-like permease family protein [Flavobacteriales bacterium]